MSSSHFPIYGECHHPNWRSHIFQRGRSTTNQHWSFPSFFWKQKKTPKTWGKSVSEFFASGSLITLGEFMRIPQRVRPKVMRITEDRSSVIMKLIVMEYHGISWNIMELSCYVFMCCYERWWVVMNLCVRFFFLRELLMEYHGTTEETTPI